MGERQPQRLGHDLRGSCRTQELASAAACSAGSTAQVVDLVDGHLSVRQPHPNRLDPPRILPLLGRQGHPAGYDRHRQPASPGEGDHHRRHPLVTGGHADHAPPIRQRADEPAQNRGCVISVGQAVEHAGRALGAPIARVGAISGKGDGTQPLEFPRRRLHQQPHLPVTGVIAQSNGSAVGGADAAHGAEYEELLAAEFRRIPTHPRVLTVGEDVATGTAHHLLLAEGETPLRPGGGGANLEYRFGPVLSQDLAERGRGLWVQADSHCSRSCSSGPPSPRSSRSARVKAK